ncbi:hypothetical protein [Mucilaginibacter sp. BT774]|uniref:hypothetical protein n=1 Tax=Mucilaginibacter sp. BT774 TaxID=3062276 RepID=UPI0026760E31|nr:hypothetical protein [Mucilaginibacter sp. BT774]MDO3624880.1 hypothetical protein [Mucilaginibacter sp. BT774]
MNRSFIAKNTFIAGIVLLSLFVSCQLSIKPEMLYGKWKYVKIENNSVANTTNVTPEQLDAESPYITFTKDSLLIWWGGKLLSHGSYKIDGDKIQFKEILEGGKIREFPFIVSQLDDKNLVFSTQGDDGAKVTALKEQ